MAVYYTGPKPVKYSYVCLDCGAEFDTVEALEKHIDRMNFLIEIKKKEKPMSDTVRMRVVLDFPVDPTTANERKLKAISKEMRNNAQILLVKDHEVTLTDDVESINVHVHRSGPDACAECVEHLALDGRS